MMTHLYEKYLITNKIENVTFVIKEKLRLCSPVLYIKRGSCAKLHSVVNLHSVMDDLFIKSLTEKYPQGSKLFETEFNSLKRKLNVVDFSDTDEENLAKTADELEKSIIKEKSDSKKDAWVHTCGKCGKRFCNNQFLKRHELSHSKVLMCDKCGKCFSKKQFLTRHMLSHQKVQCSSCKKEFCRKDSLWRHVRKSHPESLSPKQQFSCRHCDFVFTGYAKLIEHVSLQHPLLKDQVGGKQTPRLDNDERTALQSNVRETVPQDNIHAKSRLSQVNATATQSALNNHVQNKMIYPTNEEIYDLLLFFYQYQISSSGLLEVTFVATWYQMVPFYTS